MGVVSRLLESGQDIYSFFRKKYRYRSAGNMIRRLLQKKSVGNYVLRERQITEIKALWEAHGFPVPLDWYRFLYAFTGVEDSAYVPDHIFQNEIKGFFNDPQQSLIWSDKAYLDYFLRESKTVRTVVRNVSGRFMDEQFHLISKDGAQSIMDEYDSLVIKPAMNTDTGRNVQLLHRPYDLDELVKQYRENYVIQIPLKQHPDMGRLNASSVNTIRVNTVLLGTKAHVMSTFVKVGQAGEFADNSGAHRFFIGIRENGTFCDFAIDHDFGKYTEIPSGFDFRSQPFPFFEKVCEAAVKAHEQIAHFGFAFFDISIDENGEAVIVEVNLRKPDTLIAQACGNGSFFGPYAEEILKVCENKRGS